MRKQLVCLGSLVLVVSLLVPVFAQSDRGALGAAEKASAKNESRELKESRVDKAFKQNDGPANGPVEAAERAARNLEIGDLVQKDNDRVQKEQRESKIKDN